MHDGEMRLVGGLKKKHEPSLKRRFLQWRVLRRHGHAAQGENPFLKLRLS